MSDDQTPFFDDDIYLNEFHKKWTEDCLRSNEQMLALPCSAEILRAQSKRLEEMWRSELTGKRKRKGKGQK